MAGIDLIAQGSLTAHALAALAGAELRGAGDRPVEGVAPLDTAGPTDLSFVRDASFARKLAASRVGTVFITRDAIDAIDDPSNDPAKDPAKDPGTTLLVVDDADQAMVAVLARLADALPKPTPGIHPSAVVDASASIDPTASIGPGVYIGAGSTVGARTVLRANVVVEHACKIGSDCVIGPGAVVGAEGFGYLPNPGATSPGEALAKVPHIGGVVIDDHVDIGANTTIDRGKFAPTRIGTGTKIDNLVQIAHNCQIGACCILCGRVGLSGSVTLGDGVRLAGGVGVADNTTIGAGSGVGGGSGVRGDIPPGEDWVGYPAVPMREYAKRYAAVSKLIKPKKERSQPKDPA